MCLGLDRTGDGAVAVLAPCVSAPQWVFKCSGQLRLKFTDLCLTTPFPLVNSTSDHDGRRSHDHGSDSHSDRDGRRDGNGGSDDNDDDDATSTAAAPASGFDFSSYQLVLKPCQHKGWSNQGGVPASQRWSVAGDYQYFQLPTNCGDKNCDNDIENDHKIPNTYVPRCFSKRQNQGRGDARD
jgi:hypothetical protein